MNILIQATILIYFILAYFNNQAVAKHIIK